MRLLTGGLASPKGVSLLEAPRCGPRRRLAELVASPGQLML